MMISSWRFFPMETKMNSEKINIVTDTYQSSVRKLSKDLFYLIRKHEYSPPFQVVDTFGNFNIYAYAQIRKDDLIITANSQSFCPEGPVSIFIPKRSLIKWEIFSSHLIWHAYISEINFAPQIESATLFSGHLLNVTSITDISNWLKTAQNIKVFSEKKEASLAGAIKNYIDAHFQLEIEISDIAKKFNLSASQLTKIFKNEFSISPVKYRSKIRVFQSMFDLLIKESSIVDLALNAGFNDLSRFNKQFKSITKSTPSKFKFPPNKL